MEFYEPAELQRVLRPQRRLLGVELTDDGSAEIAGRSRGTPRIANRLLRRVRDYAEVEADGRVTLEVARAALALYDVDDLGLDRLDRAVLEALVVALRRRSGRRRDPRRRRGGGAATPSRRSASRSSCGPACWPAPPRGRVATEAAWRHLGRPLPRGGALLGGAGGAISGLTGAPSTPGASSEPLFGA